jgi:hypothetical protein
MEEESFGELEPVQLAERATDVLRSIADANFVASQRACDKLWGQCEQNLKRGTSAWLPSTSRYHAQIEACNATLDGCVGPAAARFHDVLLPQVAREGAIAYASSYRDRLHRSLVASSVMGVLLARFVVRSPSPPKPSHTMSPCTLPTSSHIQYYECMRRRYAPRSSNSPHWPPSACLSCCQRCCRSGWATHCSGSRSARRGLYGPMSRLSTTPTGT